MNVVGTMWALVPSLAVLVMAIKTKRLLESILVGSIIAFAMLDGVNFWQGWIDMLYEQLAIDTVIWVALTTFLLGAIIYLVQASGGSKSFTKLALAKVKNQKQSLLATILFGLIIFVCDYLNALMVSSSMKKVTDKFNVPREALGFTVISVGAPVSTIIPFSSWGAYMIGLLGMFGYTFGGTALGTYVKSIPYMVYCYVIIIIAVLLAVGIMPRFSGMKKAFARAENGQVLPDGKVMPAEDEDEGPEPKAINFILPIAALVAGTILMDNDLLYGLIIGIGVGFILYIINKTMTFSECVEACFDGARSMFEVWTIVLFCYIFVGANTRLELAEFVIASAEPLMSAQLFPAVTFAIIGALAFVTGSFWELAALSFPIMIPLGLAVGGNIYMVIGALIAGTVFGSTACFYSDTDILVAEGCDIELMDMAPKNLPYFAIAYVVSIGIHIVLGFVL